MITRFTSIEELKQLFFELLFNHTNKVTKITDQSTLNGVGYGIAKVAQKANKEIALVESHLFPESAFGQHLDLISKRRGVSPRYSSTRSTTFLRIVATPGTVYSAINNTFTGNGITFKLESDIIIGDTGYAYARVYSENQGERTNVPPLTINKVSPSPEGHKFVTNEYKGQGGSDSEDDNLFRQRILKGVNIAAKRTLDYLTQVCQKFNSDILEIRSYGIDDLGKSALVIVTQNGRNLLDEELDLLLQQMSPYVNLADYNYINTNTINITLTNVKYAFIDISIRADISLDQAIDKTRIEIQTNLSKLLDFRYWRPGQKVEWDDLLEVVKSHKMVRSVSDTDFLPNVDVNIPITHLPRVRGFILMDLEGNLLIDNGNIINPVFYPNQPDVDFQQTVLEEL